MSSEFSNVRSVFCQCTKAIVDRLHNSSAFYFDLFLFITKQLEEIETDENHLAKVNFLFFFYLKDSITKFF